MHWFDAAFRTHDGLVCLRHRVRFVTFRCEWTDKHFVSHGCPVCVGLIRAEVQRSIRMFREAHPAIFAASIGATAYWKQWRSDRAAQEAMPWSRPTPRSPPPSASSA